MQKYDTSKYKKTGTKNHAKPSHKKYDPKRMIHAA